MAAADRATMPPVLDQGKFGTCVGYAFAQALAQGILSMYGVACNPEIIAEKVKVLCPCWKGHQTERMPEEWNNKLNEAGATIENLDRGKRYRVKVNFRKVDLFASRGILRAGTCGGAEDVHAVHHDNGS